VDAERFQEWVSRHLCPFLGRYSENEPNSIVIMDNASTHMSERMKELIESTGAYLLYSAPYSPDLSPIEYLFNIYKSNLRRFSKDYSSDDWYYLHLKAILSVTKDIAIKEVRRCEIPYSNNILTEEEKKDQMLSFFYLIRKHQETKS